jgi:hypothetical protein
MTTTEITILVSFGSLFISALSLALTVYKDLIRRPKLKVDITVGKIVTLGYPDRPSRVCVSITNFGPGNTRAIFLQLRKAAWWRRLFRLQNRAVLIHDYEDPLSGHLPVDLEVGKKVDLAFRFCEKNFLNGDFNQVGISDPFGKIHWCSKKTYKKARSTYRTIESIESQD